MCLYFSEMFSDENTAHKEVFLSLETGINNFRSENCIVLDLWIVIIMPQLKKENSECKRTESEFAICDLRSKAQNAVRRVALVALCPYESWKRENIFKR